jgi:hypothetical protein
VDHKEQIIAELRALYDQWAEVLATLRDEQATTRRASSGLSLKDEMAHLYMWQQISRARLQAALIDQLPQYPRWPREILPDSEGDVDRINAWIYETHDELPWTSVREKWREGFLDFLALAEAMPEPLLFQRDKYPWLGEHTLADVLRGSHEHHQEHLNELRAWLQQDR